MKKRKSSILKSSTMLFVYNIFKIFTAHVDNYTKRKTDPKSRYFSMFESALEKCLIQLSVELIQLDISCNSMNHTQYRVESNIFRKLIQTSENIWIWVCISFSVFMSRVDRKMMKMNEKASLRCPRAKFDLRYYMK